MFKNKYVLITILIAVFAIVIIYFLIGQKEREFSPVINAVPAKPSFIIETDDLPFLSHKILKNKNLSRILPNLEYTKEFYNDLVYIDSLMNKNRDIKQFINGKTLVISAHSMGRSDIDFLFTTGSHENKKNAESLRNILSNLNPEAIISDISFAGAELVKYESPGANVFFYSFFEDYFLLSTSEILLQKSVKNINSGASLFDDRNFTSLFKQNKKNVDARIYVNYEHLFNNTDKYFSSNFEQELSILKNFADWTLLDISLKRKEIKMTGHTTIKPEMQYLSIFKNVSPDKIDVFSILPEKSSTIIQFNIGSGEDFRYLFEDFLSNVNRLNDHQIRSAEFHNTYEIDIDLNSLYNFTEDEIALIFEDVNKTGKAHNKYILIELNDVPKTKNFFSRIIKKHAELNSLNENSFTDIYIIDEEFSVNKSPVKNLPELYFGSVFSKFNAEYYTFIKDFLVFAETLDELKYFIESYTQDKTFKRKSNSYDFIKSLPGQSNIFFHTDIYQSLNVYENILSEKTGKRLSEDRESYKSLLGPVIQYISDSYPIYTTLTFALEKEERESTETVWEVRLDTVIATKPNIVLNHNTEEKEIVIQDAANKLYLIDKKGKILWTRQLDGKIISEIAQIDFYENNKLQLLFNTENKIYCIDRNGNWVEGFPVKLKSNATNGLTLLDYDKNKKYRIIIATSDNKVYLYDKLGNIIEGWEFEKTQGLVEQDIKLFQNNGKDYVVFRDNSKMYIVNRRGAERVTPEVNFALSQNSELFFSSSNSKEAAHFCITNPAGTVYKIYEDGTISKKELKKCSNYHDFIYFDVNGDRISDYIFTDNNRIEIFNGADDKRIFIKNFNTDISYAPNLYMFSDSDVRFGTSSRGKIYLIDNKGEMSDNFPLTGEGFFSITTFDLTGQFSLIVGNNDNYLYKYNIK